MKKKTMLRHIWNLLDIIDDKINHIETKIDLLKTNDLDYHEQKLLDLIDDSNENKKEISEIKSMISNISNQIAAKETPKEAPTKKSTKKTSVKK